MTKKHNLNIIFIAIFACFLWSTAFVAVKTGLNWGAKPFAFAGLRFILSGILLIPFCGSFFKYIKNIKKNVKTIFWVSIFQTFLLYGFFFWGITLVPGALAAIIIGSSPLSSAIAAHFFSHDDKMNSSKISSILVGILGIIIISVSRKPWQEAGLKEFFGVILLLLGTFTSAFGNILVSKTKGKINPFVLNSSQIFLGGVFLFILSLIVEGTPNLNLPHQFYISLLWLSLISAIAFSLWFLLLQKPEVKVSEINIWKFIVPVFGAGISWLMLANENPDWVSVLGMILVSLSILGFYKPSFKKSR